APEGTMRRPERRSRIHVERSAADPRREGDARACAQPEAGARHGATNARAAHGLLGLIAPRVRDTGAVTDPPAFATDAATAAYYERRAAEYDEWYTGDGVFAER